MNKEFSKSMNSVTVESSGQNSVPPLRYYEMDWEQRLGFTSMGGMTSNPWLSGLAALVFTVLVAAEGQLKQLQEESIANQPKQDELKKLLEKLEFLDRKISHLQTDDPMVFRDASLSGKDLVVVDLTASEIGLLDLERKVREKFIGTGRADKFLKWVMDSRLQNLHFLLLVRPGAASTFESCRNKLEQLYASYGFDVIANDRTLKMRNELEDK